MYPWVVHTFCTFYKIQKTRISEMMPVWSTHILYSLFLAGTRDERITQTGKRTCYHCSREQSVFTSSETFGEKQWHQEYPSKAWSNLAACSQIKFHDDYSWEYIAKYSAWKPKWQNLQVQFLRPEYHWTMWFAWGLNDRV